jgi:hypothetical protein
MTDTNQNIANPLDQAEAQLREIVGQGLPDAPMDASTLSRITIHIANIKRSVSTSSEDHANAAKRLGDFSDTVTRMAKRAKPDEKDMAARMSDLAHTLRSAGTALANSSDLPPWARAGN